MAHLAQWLSIDSDLESALSFSLILRFIQFKITMKFAAE